MDHVNTYFLKTISTCCMLIIYFYNSYYHAFFFMAYSIFSLHSPCSMLSSPFFRSLYGSAPGPAEPQ